MGGRQANADIKQYKKWLPNVCLSSYILLKFWFQKIVFMTETQGKVVKVSMDKNMKNYIKRETATSENKS